MTAYMIDLSAGGGVGANRIGNGSALDVDARGKDESEKKLQLLVSYLAFCSEHKIASHVALNILKDCGADAGVHGAPRTAFVEAFYRVADLGFDKNS